MRLEILLLIIVIAVNQVSASVNDEPSGDKRPITEEGHTERRAQVPRGYAEPERLAKAAGVSWATGWYVAGRARQHLLT